MKSLQKFEIVPFQEYEIINLYSILFLNEENTEFEKFFNAYSSSSKYLKDLQRIVYWIEKISERRALERYFSTSESKMKDGVCAIPIETANLRLYFLRLSDEILILGNGGIKKQRSYNTNESLNECVNVLALLDSFIKIRLKQHKIEIIGKTLKGNLSFNI